MTNQKSKHFKLIHVLVGLILPAAVIILWCIVTYSGRVSPLILPSPIALGERLRKMISDGSLWKNVYISFVRVIKGYALGAVIGVVLGIAMGRWKLINSILGTFIGILRSVPIIGWIPLIILWTGIGEGSKVVVIALATFFSVWLNSLEGMRAVDEKFKEVAVILEKNTFETMTKVVLPAATPGILTGLRMGISNAWRAVVTAEMLAASKGLGYMITYAREMVQTATVFIGVIIIGIVGWILDSLLLKLQNRLLGWNTSER